MKKTAVVPVMILFLALLYALPFTREEMDWQWTKSRDHSDGYQEFMAEWPHSWHNAEAQVLYEERVRAETKRAMIAEATKNHSSTDDPEAVQQKKARRERFFWREVTNENTLGSYSEYLRRYPDGQFAADAHDKINDFSRQGTGGTKSQ